IPYSIGRVVAKYGVSYPHFLEQADALRRSGTLCDVIISVKSHTFKAHRLVLACASRRLAQQLSKDDIDSPSCCTLEHFSPHTFQQILDFTYNHTLEVPEEDLCLLLRAAQLLDMQLLADQCRKQLDTLNQRDRGDDRKEDIESENEEENNHALEKDSKKKELAHDNKIQGNYSTEEKVNKTIVAENHSTYLSRKLFKPLPSTTYKPILSSIPILTIYGPRVAFAEPSFSKPSPQLGDGLPGLLSVSHTEPMHCSSRYGQHNKTRTVKEKKDSQSLQWWCSRWTQVSKVCAGCRFCRKQYGLKREPQSKQHDQRGDKPYQCRHCPKKFSLKHQLDTHHRVHTGEKPFECRLCGQRSRDYSAMIKHLRTHGGATPYRCTLCLEFCSSLAAMQKHIRNHAMQEFPPDWSISSTYLPQKPPTEKMATL
uniref:Zinc finger and BTB domain containing 32 n=1 Tax=Cynoglossus semilaevis TaxID=244447 RepID=A0A3P8V7J8_CYNSE